MEIDKERFKKMFPHLAKELESGKDKVELTSIRSDVQTGERSSTKKFSGYIPDVIDFLRRCDNEEPTEEKIHYQEKKGEITPQYAQRLKKQLKKKVVRSFGQKKEEDYYLKKGKD